MNSSQLETAHRQRIIDHLFDRFDVDQFEGVLLQGSMVYGRNHCVTAESDIDLLFVLCPKNLSSILEFDLFSRGYINKVAQQLFTNERIDCLWTDHTIDGLLLNMGVIRSGFFDSWTHLKSREIRRCRTDLPGSFKLGVNQIFRKTARGEDVEIPVSVTKIDDRYVVTEPLYYGDVLLNQSLYGSLLLSESLFDKHGSVQQGVQHLINKLIELYGNEFILQLVQYGLAKSSDAFREAFYRRIGY